MGDRVFSVIAPKYWNSLPDDIRNTELSTEEKNTESQNADKMEEISLRLGSQTLASGNDSGLPSQQVCRQRIGSSTSSSVSDSGQRSRKSSSRHSSVSESETFTAELEEESPEHNLEDDELVKHLLEMFPDTKTLEVAHCLCITNGDLEAAAQLLLYRQETGESILQDNPGDQCRRKKKTDVTLNDKAMKDQILNKYGYVDTAQDGRQHKPLGPKQEPKKLVRYLDGKVVSMKGERFTEIKKPDDEDMKKTYVNLKPARKYRFH